MARYNNHEVREYTERGVYGTTGSRSRRTSPRGFNNNNNNNEYMVDSRTNDYSIASYVPAHAHGRGTNIDLRYEDHTSNRGALIRPNPPVVEEPVVEHEHHHLHHHIDHGDVNSRLAMSRVGAGSQLGGVARPGLGGREYSYDDLDVRERRYPNGTTVSTIHHGHDHRHRHRHRHRSSRRRQGSLGRQGYTASDIDLSIRRERNERGYDDEIDDVTVIDVPPGSRRVYVNVDKSSNRRSGMDQDLREPDWRREHGVRRSRGLGNELWTEITKDLVTREAIEDCGYAFEETEYFYYIFEYLDRDQIAELRELTEDIRHERVRDIEYQSITGSTPRLLQQRGVDPRMGLGRGGIDDLEDSRTEIVIENSRRGSASNGRRRYYY